VIDVIVREAKRPQFSIANDSDLEHARIESKGNKLH
jgi:hypothetical protein